MLEPSCLDQLIANIRECSSQLPMKLSEGLKVTLKVSLPPPSDFENKSFGKDFKNLNNLGLHNFN